MKFYVIVTGKGDTWIIGRASVEYARKAFIEQRPDDLIASIVEAKGYLL